MPRGGRNGGPARSGESFESSELEAILVSDTYLEKLMEALKPRYDEMVKDVTEPLLKRIRELETENRRLREDSNKKIDELEQNSRLNSLRIFNLPDTDTKENCDEVVSNVFKKHLKVDISPADIDISHPLGEPRDGKVNVIVKFVQRSKRNQIFKKKSLFSTKKPGLVPNPTKISLCEDLTRTRQKMMKRLNVLYKDGKINSSWTHNGNIFVKKGESDRPKKLKIVFEDSDVDDQL